MLSFQKSFLRYKMIKYYYFLLIRCLNICSNCIQVLVEFDVISEEQLKFAIHAIDHVVAAVSLEFLNSGFVRNITAYRTGQNCWVH